MRFVPRLIATLMLLPVMAACGHSQNRLEQVLASGELRVLTRNAASSYYEGAVGPAGMEYDLAKGFADELGVKLKLIPARNSWDAIKRLGSGDGDIAAAGLAITDGRRQYVRFGPSYQEVTQQLVYRTSDSPPGSLDELDGSLEIMSHSSYAENLRHIRDNGHPDLNWTENPRAGTEELLNLVAQGLIDYTIADSNEVALNQRYYPELRVAFDVSEPQQLAWAFPKGQDDSLYEAAKGYFAKLKSQGRLAHILERYYGHVKKFNYVGSRVFQLHVQQRLPDFEAIFRRAAAKNGLDWRLIAAMAYQESLWDPDAVSPTGVRGLMMLTRTTARHLGIEERTDPVQSIEGGARYLKDLLSKVPSRIKGDDRVWLAVAAYNIGYGHLEDARVITEIRGGNPDRWMDVKKNLPLLQKKSWYQRTRYGYARGGEARHYVENIRSYYDILVWLTDKERPAPPEPPKALTIASPAL